MSNERMISVPDDIWEIAKEKKREKKRREGEEVRLSDILLELDKEDVRKEKEKGGDNNLWKL